jgi:hypothetical protein
MLPMRLQFIIVMIATAIDDRLQRKLDYVEEERRILRERLDAVVGGKKISFTAEQRRRLTKAGKLLTPDERRKCCTIVKPATFLTWFRQLAAKKYDSSEVGRGRWSRVRTGRPARRALTARSLARFGSAACRTSIAERLRDRRRWILFWTSQV